MLLIDSSQRHTRQWTQRMHSKWRITFHFQYCSTPLLRQLFCAQSFFFYVYVFLQALIFYQPKTTFQTIENNFSDQASIFRQLTFFTFHQINFTLQRWTGKGQCVELCWSPLVAYWSCFPLAYACLLIVLGVHNGIIWWASCRWHSKDLVYITILCVIK